MSHTGNEFTESSHFLRTHQVRLCFSQFSRALFHLIFKSHIQLLYLTKLISQNGERKNHRRYRKRNKRQGIGLKPQEWQADAQNRCERIQHQETKKIVLKQNAFGPGLCLPVSPVVQPDDRKCDHRQPEHRKREQRTVLMFKPGGGIFCDSGNDPIRGKGQNFEHRSIHKKTDQKRPQPTTRSTRLADLPVIGHHECVIQGQQHCRHHKQKRRFRPTNRLC